MTAVADPTITTPPASSPTHDLGSEQIAIGAMLLDPTVIAEIRQAITDPKMLYSIPHRIVFTAVCDLADARQPTTPQAVLAHLAATQPETLRKLNNGLYLSDLVDNTPVGAFGPYYARIVADRAVLRTLDEKLAAARDRIRAGAGSAAELLEETRAMIADLSGLVVAADGPVRWRDLIKPGCDRLEALENGESEDEGIPTGFPDLDKLIQGIKGGQVYVVGGMSGSGKSTLVGDLIRSAAFKHQQMTLAVTLEMSRIETFDKLVCAHASVDHGRLTSGTMTERDWIQIAKVCGETEDAPLWIHDAPRQTIADIRAEATKLHREHGPLKVLVVDLIGLVDPPNAPTREQQVAHISRSLKALAGEIGCAVIVVAQINRNPNHRADKRPTQHDLRESAQIAHDATVVILVHRPEQHDKTSQVGEAILIVDKNRFGPEGDVTVAAQLHMSRFYSMALPS